MSYYGNAGIFCPARSRGRPVFLCSDGMLLSMQQLVKEVRAALEAEGLFPVTRDAALGLEPQTYLPVRIGVEESAIQTLARWRSKVCKRYLKFDAKNLVSYNSRSLVQLPVRDGVMTSLSKTRRQHACFLPGD